MRLHTKVLVPLLLTLALLGGASVGVVVHLSEGQALAEARSGLVAHADLLADGVNASLQRRLQAVGVLASVKAQADFTVALLEAPADAEQRGLQTSLRESSLALFERVAVVGADGRERAVFAAGGPQAPDPAADHRGDPVFAHARAAPLGPAVATVAPGGTLIAAAAIVDFRGGFAGVVRGEVPVAALLPPGFRGGAPPAQLVDERGGRVGGAEGLTTGTSWSPALADVASSGAARSGADRDTLYAIAEVAGVPTPLGTQTWFVVAERPAGAATALVRGPILELGAALVGIAGAASLVVALAVRRSLRPLDRLSEAVAALGAGHPSPLVQPDGPREIRTLADAFNGMVASLREREAALAREAETRAQHAKFATIGSLCAGVAHEIKNPLTGMKLQTHLVRQHAERALEGGDQDLRSLAQSTRQMLDVNERGIDRIEKVVSSLSMLARPRPSLEVVELAPLVEASVALAGARHRGRAQVQVEVPPGLRALASSDGVGQVLLNLLANAAEAVPEGRGWIRVVAAPQGDRIEVRVEDNGPGIPPEVAKRLGEPFFTTKPKGTGLGLSLSMRIMAELGGSLRFEERPEGGARFVFDLAAPRTEPRGDPAEESEREPSDPPAARRSPASAAATTPTLWLAGWGRP